MEERYDRSFKMKFDKEGFINFLIDEGCIGFYSEPIKLSSGGESYWYVNLRKLQEDFSKLDKYTDFIVSFLKEKNLEGIVVGIPEAATLPAIEVNRKLGNPSFVYLRSRPKSHGILQGFPYSLAPIMLKGMKIIVAEDTLTTGNSAIKTALNLYLGSAIVTCILVVCYREDRRWGGLLPHEYIEKHMRIEVYTLSKASEVLPLAIERLKPSRKILKGLMEEYKDHEIISEILSQYI